MIGSVLYVFMKGRFIMKRLFTVLLALMMVFTLIPSFGEPGSAYAATPTVKLYWDEQRKQPAEDRYGDVTWDAARCDEVGNLILYAEIEGYSGDVSVRAEYGRRATIMTYSAKNGAYKILIPHYVVPAVDRSASIVISEVVGSTYEEGEQIKDYKLRRGDVPYGTFYAKDKSSYEADALYVTVDRHEILMGNYPEIFIDSERELTFRAYEDPEIDDKDYDHDIEELGSSFFEYERIEGASAYKVKIKDFPVDKEGKKLTGCYISAFAGDEFVSAFYLQAMGALNAYDSSSDYRWISWDGDNLCDDFLGNFKGITYDQKIFLEFFSYNYEEELNKLTFEAEQAPKNVDEEDGTYTAGSYSAIDFAEYFDTEIVRGVHAPDAPIVERLKISVKKNKTIDRSKVTKIKVKYMGEELMTLIIDVPESEIKLSVCRTSEGFFNIKPDNANSAYNRIAYGEKIYLCPEDGSTDGKLEELTFKAYTGEKTVDGSGVYTGVMTEVADFDSLFETRIVYNSPNSGSYIKRALEIAPKDGAFVDKTKLIKLTVSFGDKPWGNILIDLEEPEPNFSVYYYNSERKDYSYAWETHNYKEYKRIVYGREIRLYPENMNYDLKLEEFEFELKSAVKTENDQGYTMGEPQAEAFSTYFTSSLVDTPKKGISLMPVDGVEMDKSKVWIVEVKKGGELIITLKIDKAPSTAPVTPIEPATPTDIEISLFRDKNLTESATANGKFLWDKSKINEIGDVFFYAKTEPAAKNFRAEIRNADSSNYVIRLGRKDLGEGVFEIIFRARALSRLGDNMALFFASGGEYVKYKDVKIGIEGMTEADILRFSSKVKDSSVYPVGYGVNIKAKDKSSFKGYLMYSPKGELSYKAVKFNYWEDTEPAYYEGIFKKEAGSRPDETIFTIDKLPEDYDDFYLTVCDRINGKDVLVSSTLFHIEAEYAASWEADKVDNYGYSYEGKIPCFEDFEYGKKIYVTDASEDGSNGVNGLSFKAFKGNITKTGFASAGEVTGLYEGSTPAGKNYFSVSLKAGAEPDKNLDTRVEILRGETPVAYIYFANERPETPTAPGTSTGGGLPAIAPPASGAETSGQVAAAVETATATEQKINPPTGESERIVTVNAVVKDDEVKKLIDEAKAKNATEIFVDAKASGSTEDVGKSNVVIGGEFVKELGDGTDASLAVETDIGKIVIDNDASNAISAQAAGEDISLSVEKIAEDRDSLEIGVTITTKAGREITDFAGGKVVITLALPLNLKGQTDAVCLYIDNADRLHNMGGTVNADGTFSFETGHFSRYKVMSAASAKEAMTAQRNKIKSVKLKLSSSLIHKANGKKAVVLKAGKTNVIKLDGVEIFRSLKKNSGYGKTPYKVIKGTKFTNTAVKSGKKYYYKIRGYVIIDGEKIYTEFSDMTVKKIA